MDPYVEHLTPEQHIEKADAALEAAQKLRREMDDKEVEQGRARGKSSEWYLSREHDFLTLVQIVNVHANMATAKSLVLMKNRNVPVIFENAVMRNSAGDVIQEFQPKPPTRPSPTTGAH